MDEDEDALAVQIRRVARTHVDLDNALRGLSLTLVLPGLALTSLMPMTSYIERRPDADRLGLVRDVFVQWEARVL